MDVRLPKLGEGADSGVVVSLLVKEGDAVQEGQTLIELENEKAVAPIPSTASGTVMKLRVKEGDKISVGQVILSIDTGGAEVEPAKPDAAAKTPRPGKLQPAVVEAEEKEDEHEDEGGAKAEAEDFSKWGRITKKPLSQLRKVIAQRMSESWTKVPRVTQFDEADITALMDLRRKYQAAYETKGARLTLTPLALKAVMTTLKKHPIFNSSLDEAAGEIVLKQYYHIGVAVDTEAGLLVPVIRDVDKKDLLQLSREVENLAARARERKLSLDEMKGGSFTISNQGGIGGGHFTPIVNAPEVAILGLGRGELKAVVKDKQIQQRLMLPLAISYDHRVIDGGVAARFAVDLVQALENIGEEEVKL